MQPQIDMAMPETGNRKKKKKWIHKMRNKYRLVISNEDTYEEKFSFRLSRLNVFVAGGTLIILLIVGTTFLIAFTPLREYIPGYTDVALMEHVRELEKLTDSIERVMHQKDLYFNNIKNIIEGKEMEFDSTSQITSEIPHEKIKYTRSEEDSLLRKEYDSETSFNLYYNESEELYAPALPLIGSNFFIPLKGIVTAEFDISQKHYGIDIVSKENEAVKSVLDGTVIFSNWTVETGYVIGIQHQGNFMSVYKHNSVLLKQQGNFVRAGEPIAIVGESGELSSGPHLHFELWYNGTPVNPRDYFAF
ncbi:MAG: M23 family metallopeptidase [Bacteroidales bacterium]|nr:M23 family metallopeptidase [Bacteroidales bacterium]